MLQVCCLRMWERGRKRREEKKRREKKGKKKERERRERRRGEAEERDGTDPLGVNDPAARSDFLDVSESHVLFSSFFFVSWCVYMLSRTRTCTTHTHTYTTHTHTHTHTKHTQHTTHTKHTHTVACVYNNSGFWRNCSFPFQISKNLKKISYEPHRVRRNFSQSQTSKNLLRKWSRFCKNIL